MGSGRILTISKLQEHGQSFCQSPGQRSSYEAIISEAYATVVWIGRY